MTKKTQNGQQQSEQATEGKIVLRIEAPSEDDLELSEYAYVLADLKRVGIIAAGMFGMLIALSFLFR